MQQPPTAAGNDVQPETRVAQHLRSAVAQALLQMAAEVLGDGPCRGHAAGLVRVGLGDVVLGQLRQRRPGVGQAGRGHAPGAYRRADQVHGVLHAGQPVAEDKAVQRQQRQTLGPTGCGGDGPHVTGREAVFAQVAQGHRPGVDLQRLHQKRTTRLALNSVVVSRRDRLLAPKPSRSSTRLLDTLSSGTRLLADRRSCTSLLKRHSA